MEPTDEPWQAFVDAEVDAALGATTNWLTVVSRLLLGLSLGSVLVGIGGILTLSSLLGDHGGEAALADGSGRSAFVLVVGVTLMAAGPVIALKIAGLKWWQALIAAPALGAVAYAVFQLFNWLF